MSSIFGINSATDNYFSAALSSKTSKSNSSSSDSSFLGSMAASSASSLGDYALIQSGSYKKLLTAYYKKNNGSAAATEMDKTEKLNLTSVSSDSGSLNSAVNSLMNTEINEENRAELKKGLQNVIEKYNSVIDSATKVDNTAVLRQALWMTQGTSAVSVSLQDIGVKIGEGNKLVLDEEKFDKAQLATMKTLFSGRDSFMGKLASRSNLINGASNKAVNGSGKTGTYNQNASLSNPESSGSIIDSKS